MPHFAYVNGRFVDHAAARIHIEDRGYQFADGVYEVLPVRRCHLIDEGPHLDRLAYSLRELRIDWPKPRRALAMVARELVRRNGVREGFLYLQVTRGVAPREHRFPANCKPSLVMTTRRLRPVATAIVNDGVAVITLPDIRWGRCDIKSLSLLPNVLGKQQAIDARAYEAWLVDRNGQITEGTSTNAWIVTADGKLVTRELGPFILGGVTRAVLLNLLRPRKMVFEERPFSVEEARNASEAFLTSSTNFVVPVTRIDGRPVGNGRPGTIARQLRDGLLQRADEQSGS